MPTHSLNTNFDNAQVLVVGDIMLDRYWTGDTGRISPEAPVPVVQIKDIEQRTGGAGNVAVNIAALGGQAQIAALVGEDEAAEALHTMLEAENIQAHLSKDPLLPTAIKLRILSRHQQLIRADFEENFAHADHSTLFKSFQTQLSQAKAVILSDYGKGTLADPAPFINACREANIPVLVDPKGNDFSKYAGATLITPNRSEFEAVAGKCGSFDEMADKARAVCNAQKLDALLITLSEDGMMLVQANGDVHQLPTKAREVFDVTGAGDTVIATFATAIAAGHDYFDAMEYANVAAGVVVAKLGTSTVSQAELHHALAKQDSITAHKIMTDAQLKTTVAALKQQGKTVVMTNGCFDILHTGHISYLQAARQRGDVLVVAVNSDDSVQRLKGDNRPIVGLNERMEMLAALEAVDYVVSFKTDTPEALYCEILPSILVKGGDYKPEEIAGADCVQTAGGTVEVLHFVEGQSTSAIVKKIKEST